MTKYNILYNTESIVQSAGAGGEKKDLLITIGIILLVVLAITFLNSSKKMVPLDIENTFDKDIEHPFVKDIERPIAHIFDPSKQPSDKQQNLPANIIQTQRQVVNQNDTNTIPHGVLNPNTAEYASV